MVPKWRGIILTSESEFRKYEQVQVFGVRFAEDGVGTVEIIVDVADLRGELQTGDPHLRVASLGSQSIPWVAIPVTRPRWLIESCPLDTAKSNSNEIEARRLENRVLVGDGEAGSTRHLVRWVGQM